MKKGTKRHKQIGYAYVVSMAILLTTAFMIYQLFNGWGIFHYTTIASLVATALGMIIVHLLSISLVEILTIVKVRYEVLG